MKVKHMDMRQINQEFGEYDLKNPKRAAKNKKELLKRVRD